MRLRSIFIYGVYILEMLCEKCVGHLLKMMLLAFISINKWMRKWKYQSSRHNTIYTLVCVCVCHVSIYQNVLLSFPLDMSQFGLGTANSHWGYSSANYSPYLTSGGLSTCGTTSASQFNNPALGFSCTATDQASTQDFTNNARECLPSKL